MAQPSKNRKTAPKEQPSDLVQVEDIHPLQSPLANWKPLLQGLVIVVATLMAYLSVWHAGFIWDDDAYVTGNMPLRSWHGLWQIWFELGTTEQYYPLTNTTFWVEYHLWRLNPLGYHLDNVLLHASNAILFWVLLRKLDVKGAWLAAAIFAVHPVCVESVAWVTERKNTLSGFFFLSSLLASVKFWKLDTTNPDSDSKAQKESPKQWKFFWLAIFLYLIALSSKSSTVPLPIVILLLLWWKKSKFESRDLYPLVPFLMLGFSMGILTLWVDKHYVGTTGAEWALSWAQRFIIIGSALWFYLDKLIWPYPLIFIYPRWNIDASQPLMYLPPLAAIGGLIVLWWKRNTRLRPVFLAIAYFVILLFPVCGIFNQYNFRYSFVADHLQYLASMGIFALAGAGITIVLTSLKKLSPFLAPALCGLLFLTLGWLTSQQCTMYSDIEMLYRTTLERNPTCLMAYNNLGDVLQKTGRFSEAIGLFKQALQIEPENDKTLNNFGRALQQTGQMSEAVDLYEQALRINPDFAEAHNNLGSVLEQTGRLLDAIEQYKQAMQINPYFAVAHNNLGNALRQTGQLSEATEQFEQALKIDPDYAEAHCNLGNALKQSGRVSEAIEQFDQALRINPDFAEARNNLGNALGETGRISEAIEQYEQALRIKPDFTEVHYNLGNALAQTGRISKAIEQYEQVVKTQPNFAEGHYTLGLALQQTGRLLEAEAQFEATLQIDPTNTEAQVNLKHLKDLQEAVPVKK